MGDLPGHGSHGADDEVSICNEPGPDTVVDPLARYEVQFQQSDLGPFVAETITAYRTEAEARGNVDTDDIVVLVDLALERLEALS